MSKAKPVEQLLEEAPPAFGLIRRGKQQWESWIFGKAQTYHGKDLRTVLVKLIRATSRQKGRRV